MRLHADGAGDRSCHGVFTAAQRLSRRSPGQWPRPETLNCGKRESRRCAVVDPLAATLSRGTTTLRLRPFQGGEGEAPHPDLTAPWRLVNSHRHPRRRGSPRSRRRVTVAGRRVHRRWRGRWWWRRRRPCAGHGVAERAPEVLQFARHGADSLADARPAGHGSGSGRRHDDPQNQVREKSCAAGCGQHDEHDADHDGVDLEVVAKTMADTGNDSVGGSFQSAFRLSSHALLLWPQQESSESTISPDKPDSPVLKGTDL